MNNLPPPACSVIIPVFNYARYVEHAIKSVQSQTLNNFECIIVNDGSTDDSERVILESIKHDARFRLINIPNGGVANARNTGIKQSNAPFFVCLDADDAIHPEFLMTVISALEIDVSLGVGYTGLILMTHDGELSPNAHSFPPLFDFEAQAVGRNCVPTCCGVRREAWERAGGYRKELEPTEDANLWLRITALGYGARKVTDEGMFYYRLHPNSLSSTVRRGEKKEPKWNDFAWVDDGLRPFAAPPKPPLQYANPVRNYDTPKVSIIVQVLAGQAETLPRALDSIERQSERFLECLLINYGGDDLGLIGYAWVKHADKVEQASAPLIVMIGAGEVLPNDFLQRAIMHYQRTGAACELNGIVLQHRSDLFTDTPRTIVHTLDTLSDMLRVEYISVDGYVTGRATQQRYGFKRTGDFMFVWTKDAQAMPNVFKPVAPVIGVNKTPVPPKPKRLK